MAVKIDYGNFGKFANQMNRASKGGFQKALNTFLQGLGAEFLRIVQDEIIHMKIVDTRLMLASFRKGKEDNVWEIRDGGLTLEVGSNVKYARFVNDGYHTMGSDMKGALKNPDGSDKLFGGVQARFIPGYWHNDRFVYDPGADEGMVLKSQWIVGRRYWESAINIFEKIFPKLLEKKIEEWFKNYFGMK
ncbi:MAG: HK97 gp10 family phage protein [Defluviitaleaceae bacterium]|nr:HK97 gp10 family phage protein [Defluviitaleaceae bacterium]